jgi:hypothetical protein
MKQKKLVEPHQIFAQDVTIEDLVLKHGKPHRGLIEDAIKWLDETQPKWGLTKLIDRKTFIGNIIKRSESTNGPIQRG